MKRYPRDGNRAGGEVATLSAPVGGLRTNSALIGLAPNKALQLDNLICQPDALISRLGCSEWATGFTGTGPHLMSYNAAAGNEMFLATSEGLWDVTSSGAVGSSLATLTSGRGRSVNTGVSGGHFLYFVNGVDDALIYDGTTWQVVDGTSTPIALTGVATSSLFHVVNYRERLMFLAKGELGFRYLATDAVSGALTLFRIGALTLRGGEVVSHATWSIDGGDGQDDYYVVATSEGEVVIFSGSNPGDANSWAPRGRFDLGRPVSPDCFCKLAGDLLYFSEDGIFPLSRALMSVVVNRAKSVTRDIEPTLVEAVRTFRNNDGWFVQVVPRWGLILVNVPETFPKQFVFSTLSNGWSRFTGWSARCWHIHEGDTYFATNDKVFLAFAGQSDAGVPISWAMRTSYQMLKQGANQTMPLLTRPLVAFDKPTAYSVGFARDYKDEYLLQNIPAAGGGTIGLWNSGLWNVALWGGGFALQDGWFTVPADEGLALSMELSGQLTDSTVVILGANVKFSLAGAIT